MSIDDWLKVGGTVVALLALCVAVASHAQRVTFEMIDRLYSLCHALQAHALRDWYLGPVLHRGRGVRAGQGAGPATRPGRAGETLRVSGRGKLFAIHVFVVYEQVYYQLQSTPRWLISRRRKFLWQVLSYFTNQLLINPRLLHFFRFGQDGGQPSTWKNARKHTWTRSSPRRAN